MLLIPEPLIELITKLPGSLLYNMAILVCIATSLHAARVMRGKRTENNSERISVGLSLLLVLQLIIMVVDIASSAGYLNNIFLVLVANIAFICLSILVLTSTWCYIKATKPTNFLVIGVSVLILAFFAYTAITTISTADQTLYDASLRVTIWLLVGVILSLASVVIIAVVKPVNWGVAILLLVLLSAGMIGQYFFSLSRSFLPFPLRIASLFAFPLLPGVIKLLHPKYFSLISGADNDEQIDSKLLPVKFELINKTAQDYENLVKQLQQRIDNLLMQFNYDDDITKLASFEATLSETSQLLKDTISLNYLVSQWYDWSGTSGKRQQNHSEFLPAVRNIYQSIFALKGYINILSKPYFPLGDVTSNCIIEESNYFLDEIAASSKQMLGTLQDNQPEDYDNPRLTNIHQVLAAAIASVDKIIQQKNISLSLKIPDSLPDLGISYKFLHFQLTRLLSATFQISENGSVISLTVTIEGETHQQVIFSFFVSNLRPATPLIEKQLLQEYQHKYTDELIEFYSLMDIIKVAIAAVSGQLESHQTICGGLNINLKFPID